MSDDEAGGRDFMGDWIAANQAQKADYLAIATDQVVLAFVRERIKKSRGRTMDVPLKCGDHLTGLSVALAVSDDQIEVIHLREASMPDSPDPRLPISPTGLSLKGAVGSPLRVLCPICSRRVSHTVVWVLRKTLAALADAHRASPVIQIRTST